MARIYRRGEQFYLDWFESGQRNRRSLGTIPAHEAETIRKAKEVELATGQRIISTAPRFGDYADDYVKWYEFEYPASYERVEQIIRCHLKPAFKFLSLEQIDPRAVDMWKGSRRQAGVKFGTINKELRTLKAMLNRAVEWKIIPVHPCPKVKGIKETDSKPPRWYTGEELGLIYEHGESFQAVWKLLANTGLRRGEAMHLKRKDVGAQEMRVISTDEERTKSGKYRIIPLSPGAQAALESLKSDKPYVLPRMVPSSVSRKFAQTLVAAELDGSLHCLRHTFCSHLVIGGIPLRTVQELAGHSTIAVTERYAHLSPGHLRGATAGLCL